MENFREIEKMFTIDSARKKKIGSNVHRMRGKGKKGGLKHGILLGQSKFDKPYSKNSKTVVSNIKSGICSLEMFEEFSEEKQKDVLDAWLDQFSVVSIAKGLGVSARKVENLKAKLGVEKLSPKQALDRRKGKMKYVDMERLKPESFDKKYFNLLSDGQKYNVVQSLKDEYGYTNKGLAGVLDIKSGSLNSYISVWRKSKEEGNLESEVRPYNEEVESPHVTSFLDDGLRNVETESVEYSNNNTNEDNKTSTNSNSISPSINYDGIYVRSEAAKNLRAIADLIDGDGEVKVNISIQLK